LHTYHNRNTLITDINVLLWLLLLAAKWMMMIGTPAVIGMIQELWGLIG
jgi:hypothetical protein